MSMPAVNAGLPPRGRPGGWGSAVVNRQVLVVGDAEIPNVDVRGAQDGPYLTVLAGVHGTEYTLIATVREFAAGLDPDRLAGRVTAVPLVNPEAFWARSPFVVPGDGKNLNRCFPGDPFRFLHRRSRERAVRPVRRRQRLPARPARG